MFSVPHQAPILVSGINVEVGNIFTSADGANYVCILAFVSASILPENDTLHFKKVSELDRIYVHDEGDLSKYYGVVFDTLIEMIVNPQITEDKVFDNIEINSGPISWTDITYRTSDQSVTDKNIITNTEYEFRY